MTDFVKKEKLSTLIVGTIGIVYGDIGTSPLYALKSCLSMAGSKVEPTTILGVISLFIWALILIVTIKYIKIVLTVNNNGEGGILALSSLALSISKHLLSPKIFVLGLLGMALFFGDGIITPAISVLSAVEGISLMGRNFNTHIIPITLLILTILFSIQKYGSNTIGQFFGPIMIVWFSVLFILGLYHIYSHPDILLAFNPYHALTFITNNLGTGFMIIGGVVLVVTGNEALYADLGHFGEKPIRISWTFFVFPALVANYLGQGALLVHSPHTITNPFYLMVPEWGLTPLIVLSTLATIIASQAIITGLYSITWQAIVLNYLPKMKIINTSTTQIGQVYISTINWIVYFLTCIAVLFFGSSEKLAYAYGVCVSAIMLITTCLIFFIASEKWNWSWFKLMVLFIPLFLLDSLFVFTNLIKFVEGAWYTLTITSLFFYITLIWIKGNKSLQSQKITTDLSVQDFINQHLKDFPFRIPGTAIFLSRESLKIPCSLLIHLEHNKYLHEKIIFLTIKIKKTPYQKADERFSLEWLTKDTAQLICNFGYKEIPDLNRGLQWLKDNNVLQEEHISIFISKGIPVSSKLKVLSGFSERLYIFLASFSQNATDFYRLPHHMVLELGIRYKI